MIKITYTLENGGVVLERPLTDEEKATVTSQAYNGNQAIFFQGDEPKEEFVIPKSRPVETWKVRSVLKTRGLFNSIEAAIGTLQDPIKTQASEALNYSSTINQFSPIVSTIKEICNLTDEEVTSIFDEAEQIFI